MLSFLLSVSLHLSLCFSIFFSPEWKGKAKSLPGALESHRHKASLATKINNQLCICPQILNKLLPSTINFKTIRNVTVNCPPLRVPPRKKKQVPRLPPPQPSKLMKPWGKVQVPSCLLVNHQLPECSYVVSDGLWNSPERGLDEGFGHGRQSSSSAKEGPEAPHDVMSCPRPFG